MYPELSRFIAARVAEFDSIPADRRAKLDELAAYVADRVRERHSANLTFICTHNSRRSHMSQLWAATAADHFGVPGVHTYSGGTEATAFNPRAVAALERAGFQIARTTDDRNPIYHVRSSADREPMTCFSKVYNQAPNPASQFCAVMTCSDADRNCPSVAGADARVTIPYIDPKVSDNTPKESAHYDERCEQIAREMFYVFSSVKKSIGG